MNKVIQDHLAATLADARAKAEAATPGPWTSHEEHGRDYTDEGWSYVAVRSAGADLAVTYPLPSGYEHDQHEADAAHIARMDPATTLLLLDAVETLRAESERLLAWRKQLLDEGFGYDDSEESAKEVLDWAAVWRAQKAGTEARAEAAEARVAALETTLANVRALAGRFAQQFNDVPGMAAINRMAAANAILTALDGPQDGGGER